MDIWKKTYLRIDKVAKNEWIDVISVRAGFTKMGYRMVFIETEENYIEIPDRLIDYVYYYVTSGDKIKFTDDGMIMVK